MISRVHISCPMSITAAPRAFGERRWHGSKLRYLHIYYVDGWPSGEIVPRRVLCVSGGIEASIGVWKCLITCMYNINVCTIYCVCMSVCTEYVCGHIYTVTNVLVIRDSAAGQISIIIRALVGLFIFLSFLFLVAKILSISST